MSERASERASEWAAGLEPESYWPCVLKAITCQKQATLKANRQWRTSAGRYAPEALIRESDSNNAAQSSSEEKT